MISVLHVPNTNPVLDPTYAKAETERCFKPQLDLGREVCEYGSRLLQRIFNTSEKSFDNLILVTIQFRHVLAMLDAVVLSLENGATYAAEVPLRALLEGAWTLEWMLRKGAEGDRLRFYVAFLRARRSWLKSLIPNSREYRAFHAVLEASQHGELLKRPPEQVQQFRANLRHIDNLLHRKRYRAINARFIRQERKPGRDVEWYKTGRPGSLRELTREIGKEEEYAAFYRSFSYTVHGSAIAASADVSEKTVTVEPIRTVSDFAQTFQGTLTLAFRMFRLMLERYRSGELDSFRQTYLERWRARLWNVPTVKVETEPVIAP